MKHYEVYGSCLESTVELPELRRWPGAGAARWTFTTTPALDTMREAVELGSERIYGECFARLFRHSEGHRITVDDTGIFDLSPDLRTIRWQHKEDAWQDYVRAHLIGRVLATALYLEGWLPLHGSAVSFGGDVVAFLAPKGFGKSSVAYALTGFGGKLVTDDTLAVQLGSPPSAWPGVHSMRVRGDSITALGRGETGPETREGKTLITDLDESLLARTPGPLRALYLLDPMRPEAGATVSRTQLPTVLGAVAAVGHVKIAGMLGGSAARVLLDRCAEVVGTAPVFRLSIPRDLDALPDTAAQIAAWHAAGRAEA